MTVEISLTDPTAEAIAEIQHGAELLVEALADETRARFRDNVHVITGAMRESAAVITPHGSDYAERVAAAASRNPQATFASEAVVGPGEAMVQVPVGYAGFEEFGTSARTAHPALVPAAESVAADAEAIAKRVFDL